MQFFDKKYILYAQKKESNALTTNTITAISCKSILL